MLVSTENSNIWRKVIGQAIHGRPTICSWSYKPINSDTQSSNQVKKGMIKCCVLGTSLGHGNIRSIRQLRAKPGPQVLLLWVWTYTALQGTAKHQHHPCRQLIFKATKASKSWGISSFLPFFLPFLFFPCTTEQTTGFIFYTVIDKSIISTHAPHSRSFLAPHTPQERTAFSWTQTEQTCRLLYCTSPSSQT